MKLFFSSIGEHSLIGCQGRLFRFGSTCDLDPDRGPGGKFGGKPLLFSSPWNSFDGLTVAANATTRGQGMGFTKMF